MNIELFPYVTVNLQSLKHRRMLERQLLFSDQSWIECLHNQGLFLHAFHSSISEKCHGVHVYVEFDGMVNWTRHHRSSRYHSLTSLELTLLIPADTFDGRLGRGTFAD